MIAPALIPQLDFDAFAPDYAAKIPSFCHDHEDRTDKHNVTPGVILPATLVTPLWLLLLCPRCESVPMLWDRASRARTAPAKGFPQCLLRSRRFGTW
jgi:hypothetical protein